MPHMPGTGVDEAIRQRETQLLEVAARRLPAALLSRAFPFEEQRGEAFQRRRPGRGGAGRTGAVTIRS